MTEMEYRKMLQLETEVKLLGDIVKQLIERTTLMNAKILKLEDDVEKSKK